jgi:aspartyl-tRNA(Asn)/glutamyl-tRNA(Gln) amidotransferase subunit A
LKNFLSLTEIQNAIQAKQISVESLTQYYLKRIQEHSNLNAFIEVFGDAIEQAQKVDQKIQSGKAGKLAGMVIGIKDLISFKGHKVSASSKILEGYTAPFNSTVVERLLSEDAVIIGRLSCDEFAMGASNQTSFFGPVRNADDPSKVPGGSSGGSAVAVQADLCQLALGTDTGGSIRQPASFCGVIGLKPTYSRVSRYGIVAYASSFDQVGPIGKSMEDVALVMEVIAGKDIHDATSSSLAVPQYSKSLTDNTLPKAVAFIPETIHSEGIDPEVKASVLEVLDKLSSSKVQVNESHFDMLDYVVPTYYILTTAEASSNLSRYDGVRFGYRAPESKTLEEVYKKSRSQGFGEEVKRRIMLGTFVLSAGYYDAYYAKAQKVRRLIQEKTFEMLEKNEFIILPTAPTTAFAIGENLSDPVAMYLADIYTVQASLAGLPAISIPIKRHSNGLSIGIQVVGKKFSEDKLLTFVNQLLSL